MMAGRDMSGGGHLHAMWQHTFFDDTLFVDNKC
jgi:hypothetical protein